MNCDDWHNLTFSVLGFSGVQGPELLPVIAAIFDAVMCKVGFGNLKDYPVAKLIESGEDLLISMLFVNRRWATEYVTSSIWQSSNPFQLVYDERENWLTNGRVSGFNSSTIPLGIVWDIHYMMSDCQPSPQLLGYVQQLLREAQANTLENPVYESREIDWERHLRLSLSGRLGSVGYSDNGTLHFFR
jgi:hypothetical protein